MRKKPSFKVSRLRDVVPALSALLVEQANSSIVGSVGLDQCLRQMQDWIDVAREAQKKAQRARLARAGAGFGEHA